MPYAEDDLIKLSALQHLDHKVFSNYWIKSSPLTGSGNMKQEVK